MIPRGYALLRCNLTSFFFFNDTATTEIYTLSLHDALPIWTIFRLVGAAPCRCRPWRTSPGRERGGGGRGPASSACRDRKSTRLNSSHANISDAGFCLKKKKKHIHSHTLR